MTITQSCAILASGRGGAFRDVDQGEWIPWRNLARGVVDGPPMRRRVDAKRWVERELAKGPK